MLKSYYKLFTPKGPSFKHARWVEMDFSGTKVRFYLPAYNYHMVPDDDAGFDDRVNIYDPDLFVSAYEWDRPEGFIGESRDLDVPVLPVGKEKWSFFRGAVLREHVATLNFGLVVRRNSHRGSLFNPVNHEQAIIEMLNADFGPDSDLGYLGRRFQCPLRWSSSLIGGVSWVSYYIDELTSGGGVTEWSVALSDEHFLVFSFREIYGKYSDVTGLREVIDAFIRKIVTSCVIEYGPDTSEQLEKAKEKWPDARFSGTVEPLAWIIYDEEPERFLSDMEKDMLELQRKTMASNLKHNLFKYYNLSRPTLDERMDAQREKAKAMREAMEKKAIGADDGVERSGTGGNS